MLDLKAIREDPGPAREALARRGAAEALDELLAIDARRRELLPQVEEGRARRNSVSDQIAEAKRSGEDAEGPIAEMRELGGEIKRMEAELAEVEARRDELAATLPNLASPDAPDGEEGDGVTLREVGEVPEFGFEVRDHLDLGTQHGWIEMEKAAEVSGSRFAYLLGDLVMIELALIRFAVDTIRAHGFEPVVPPVLVRESALYGTGYFPGERDMIYKTDERDDLFLVGTSEVPLGALHAGDILDASELPIRYAGISTCFRREAGAAGKDTRGIFRVHQFDKVEMFSFVDPALSESEHERILAIEEEILQALEIPYRVVDIPVGDLGGPAARKFDCEAWIPSQGRYRELTSCSNTTDYQARRLGARFRRSAEAAPEVMHTLNGTATAVGRTLIALIENGQAEDASVRMPQALVEAGAPEVIGSAS
ncbi:MAG TPA: serine--tRNA ligase [Solirubrobacterales bacterium]|nr:serine--tRNA ligase [Solirubrobacterales bacterium]